MSAPPPVVEGAARDRLALERTHLANERTLLAYLRTAVVLAASGGTLVKLSAGWGAERVFGVSLLALAGLLFCVGVARFARGVRRITRSAG